MWSAQTPGLDMVFASFTSLIIQPEYLLVAFSFSFSFGGCGWMSTKMGGRSYKRQKSKGQRQRVKVPAGLGGTELLEVGAWGWSVGSPDCDDGDGVFVLTLVLAVSVGPVADSSSETPFESPTALWFGFGAGGLPELESVLGFGWSWADSDRAKSSAFRCWRRRRLSLSSTSGFSWAGQKLRIKAKTIGWRLGWSSGLDRRVKYLCRNNSRRLELAKCRTCPNE